MQGTKSVTKPGKQRKMLFQAPDHIRYKHFAALLSPELRASHGVRTLSVRSGDTVRIMRGDRTGFEGKVTRVDRMKYVVYVEGLTREKVDGTTVFVPVHPSKIMVTNLNLKDKWRKRILERKSRKTMEEVTEKPREEEAAEAEEPAEKKIVKKGPRKRKKTTKKPAEKRVEETPKERKKTKKVRKKKTLEAKKKEKPKAKTRASARKTKKTRGGK